MFKWCRLRLAVAGTLGLLSVPMTASWGQQQPPPTAPTYQGSQPAQNSNVYGGGGWGGGYHSSTAAGDAMQGMSSAISAQGQKNLNDSLALRNLTAARSSSIDNQVKHTEAYRWREDSAKQRQQQQIAEHRAKMEPWLAKKRLQPLTSQQYDRTSGTVHWPMLCADPAYEAYRKRLDELLAKQADYGALSMEEYMEVEKTIKDWRMAITADSKTKNYPADPVGQALRFLLSLNHGLNEQFG
ncbi:hypothetical protein N9N28_12355 [Rubripirellula amarantea]|nr:hypothetical protein [Rubripirellula amarantea]